MTYPMLPTTMFAASLVLVAVALMMIAREFRVRALNVRITKAMVGTPGGTAPANMAMDFLSALGQRYRKFYAPENLEQLRTVVQSSGFNPHRMMPIILGAKTASMLGFPAFAFAAAMLMQFSFGDTIVLLMVATPIGIMGPRLILRYIGRRFNAAVNRGTPDAIDLLVICSESGMGLESGLERVAREMQRSNQPMSQVLLGLLEDLRVLPNRADAFANLSARSTSDGIRRFGVMINQSLQYGTSLNVALRAVSAELRQQRIIKLEERAHKLGAKLILPMVIFMLPAMGVILAASPFLHLIESVRML